MTGATPISGRHEKTPTRISWGLTIQKNDDHRTNTGTDRSVVFPDRSIARTRSSCQPRAVHFGTTNDPSEREYIRPEK